MWSYLLPLLSNVKALCSLSPFKLSRLHIRLFNVDAVIRKGVEKPVFSCLTCRLVLLGHTDKSGLFAAFVKHKLLCGIGGFVIVMTNAVCTLVFLSHNYHRHTHFFSTASWSGVKTEAKKITPSTRLLRKSSRYSTSFFGSLAEFTSKS